MSETEGAVGVEEVPAPVNEGTQPQTKKRRASENGLPTLQKNGSVDKEKSLDESYFAYVPMCSFCRLSYIVLECLKKFHSY